MASVLDLLFHDVITRYRQATFDPDRWAKHREIAAQQRRHGTPPADLPEVAPVALRPRDWVALPQLLTRPADPPVEEVEGHEAHERLQALLT